MTVRHFADYCRQDNITLDLEDEYASAQAILDFFDTGRIKLSGPRLYHVRDFLKYLGKQLSRESLKAQDQVMDIRDKLSMERLEPDEKDDGHQKEPEFIPDEDIEQAMEEATRFGELMLRILFDTGCRKRELVALHREDIDFDADEVGAAVQVTKQYDGDDGYKPPKQDGVRTVELRERTADMLEDYVEEKDVAAGERIFKEYSLSYCERKIGTVVKDAFTKADVQINPDTGTSFVSPHWIRHQTNTRLRKQYPKDAVMQYMGHEDADTSDHYTHYDPEEIQALL